MQAVDFADLDAFVAIARHRSFRRAAKDRGVAASTLSQSLRALEERLGVRLLNRTTRSVTPTEAGQELLGRLVPALSDITDALDRVNRFRDTPSGTLRLNVPMAVGELIIAPLIVRFLAAYPQLKVELVAEDALVDVVERGFDAGVRYGESLARDMIAGGLRARLSCIDSRVLDPSFAGREFDRALLAEEASGDLAGHQLDHALHQDLGGDHREENAALDCVQRREHGRGADSDRGPRRAGRAADPARGASQRSRRPDLLPRRQDRRDRRLAARGGDT